MGYRQSSFDPLAPSAPVGPARPFNWVQWIGVAFEAAAIAILLWHFAGLFGWTGAKPVSPVYVTSSALIGLSLINSRTQPLAAEDDAQHRRNRIWLSWTLGIVGTLVLIAVMIDLYK
jgi:hypothetical protein